MNTTDHAAVEAALQEWHRALETHDWAAAATGLTAGFLMVEHDRIMDKAALMDFLIHSSRHGCQRATLHGFHTRVEQDCAWTTMFNDELWLDKDGSATPFRFLETAVLHRVGHAWLIERYHATRLPTAAKD